MTPPRRSLGFAVPYAVGLAVVLGGAIWLARSGTSPPKQTPAAATLVLADAEERAAARVPAKEAAPRRTRAQAASTRREQPAKARPAPAEDQARRDEPARDKPRNDQPENPAQRKPRAKPKGILPDYYADVVSEEQRQRIYAIQRKYATQLEHLEQEIARLKAAMNEEIEATLQPEQLDKIRQKRSEAEARQAAEQAGKGAEEAPDKQRDANAAAADAGDQGKGAGPPAEKQPPPPAAPQESA